MATLTIGDRKVTVGDAFLSMSPAEQQANVDEIAQSLGLQGPDTPQQPPQGAQEAPNSFIDRAMTQARGFTEGIPIVGPLMQRATDFGISQVQGAFGGGNPEQINQGIQDRAEARNEANPMDRLAGNLTGGLASFGGMGATQLGQQALGLTGKLVPRMINSGVTTGILSGGDAIARGDSPGGVSGNTIIGAGIGAAIPGLGALAKTAARPIANMIRGARAPEQEATNRVAQALIGDRANPSVPVMTSAQEGIAAKNNIPLMNVDRGGETVRALARQAANSNPTARSILTKAADDRFVGQSQRVQELFGRIAGGDVNAVLSRAKIAQEASQNANPAYRALFNKPENQSVLNNELIDLLRSPTMRNVVNKTTAFGQDMVAGTGARVPPNPFVFGADGSVSVQPGVRPTLEFWNYTKRLLDREITAARKTGDPQALQSLRARLVGILDAQVPEYAAVRGARYKLFQAEDAITAGENFAKTSGRYQVDEVRNTLATMSRDERKAFEVGFTSRIMQMFNARNERTNLMAQFKIPAFKEQLELVYGKARAREIEGFVRVEDIVDQARGLLGNSTTARQLAEMGLFGGVGSGVGLVASGGDWKSAGAMGLLTLAGRRGFQMAGQRVDERVLQKVAELLASGNKAEISRVVSNAMLSPPHMATLEAIQAGLGLTARAGLQATALN